jgi:hypothetical protein
VFAGQEKKSYYSLTQADTRLYHLLEDPTKVLQSMAVLGGFALACFFENGFFGVNFMPGWRNWPACIEKHFGG